jgi:hypothetical protein
MDQIGEMLRRYNDAIARQTQVHAQYPSMKPCCKERE